MGQYSLDLTDRAKKDLRDLKKAGSKTVAKRINRIFEELGETPYLGIGNPEPLKHEWSGYWSREIDKKNRIVYSVNDTEITVLVVSAKGHYGDK
jgi:toxin YoeB